MARRPRPGDGPPAPSPEEELARLTDELGLTALREAIPKVLAAVEKEACSYTELLLRVLRAETVARDARRRERALPRSGLGPEIDLEHFDFSIRPGLDARAVRELLHCRFVGERRGLVLVGPPGTGKTHVGRAIGHAALRAGHTVLYRSTAAVLEDLSASLVDGSYRRTLCRHTKPTLLILEEFGAMGFDSNAARHLFRLTAERYEKSSTVVIANTGFRRWKTFFPSEAECVATVDRLIDRATILRFGGKPMRDPRDTLGAPLDDEAK